MSVLSPGAKDDPREAPQTLAADALQQQNASLGTPPTLSPAPSGARPPALRTVPSASAGPRLASEVMPLSPSATMHEGNAGAGVASGPHSGPSGGKMQSQAARIAARLRRSEAAGLSGPAPEERAKIIANLQQLVHQLKPKVRRQMRDDDGVWGGGGWRSQK